MSISDAQDTSSSAHVTEPGPVESGGSATFTLPALITTTGMTRVLIVDHAQHVVATALLEAF